MAAAENHLIELLPRNDRRCLLTVCEPVELSLGEVLYEPGSATTHVYFPVDGLISLIARTTTIRAWRWDGGPRGMLGLQLALGVANAVARSCKALVRPGESRPPISVAGGARPALQRIEPPHVSLPHWVASAACLYFDQIGPRLARWLLMSQDRAHADSFHITQEFLAYMLGVRRVGITQAAGSLQRGGLIEYRRGTLKVLDRPGLEAMACACYAADSRSYEGLL